MNKSIYDLVMHESTEVHGYCIIRVPGGWIYRFKDVKNDKYGTTGTFVPMVK